MAVSRVREAEFVVARIIAAFARTGLTPIDGDRIACDPDIDETDSASLACAVGAVAAIRVRARKPVPKRLWPAINIAAPFGRRTACVLTGWDDAVASDVHSKAGLRCCGRRYCDYYAAGAAAAVAMEVAPHLAEDPAALVRAVAGPDDRRRQDAARDVLPRHRGPRVARAQGRTDAQEGGLNMSTLAPSGWFSRRHQTSAVHARVVALRTERHAAKMQRAKEQNERTAQRTPEQVAAQKQRKADRRAMRRAA